MPRLTRTKLALRWAVEELIRRATSPCGFYLFTVENKSNGDVPDWREVSSSHRYLVDLMNKAQKRGHIKPWAAVRVFEEGDKTKRPHAHWVCTPAFSQATMQRFASAAGMGHVWRDTRPAGEALADYLTKYMSKSKSIAGVRRWACLGGFSATVKTKDIVIDTEHTRAFGDAMQVAKAKGLGKSEAYTYAARCANLQKYGITSKNLPDMPSALYELITATALPQSPLGVDYVSSVSDVGIAVEGRCPACGAIPCLCDRIRDRDARNREANEGRTNPGEASGVDGAALSDEELMDGVG